jgi:uncharacterized protein (UPF0147 family)
MNLSKSSSEHSPENGNGWSKYQIMVLQQLEDHNRVLQNLNKDIAEAKQQLAVTGAETALWRSSTISALENLERKLSHILYDDKGLNRKISDMEKHFEVEEKATSKLKAIWAFYGAIVVFLTNLAVKAFEFITKS